MMHISDALSRAYITELSEEREKMLPITLEKYTETQSATKGEMEILMRTIQYGWLDSRND
jgi:hypothetical protein